MTSRPAARRGLGDLAGSAAVASAVVVTLLGASPAQAHGSFQEGSPGPGDAVAPGSTVLALRFESIDPGSRATVELSATGQGAEGVRPVGAALVLGPQRTVCASTEPLTAGIWTVGYTLSSPDGAVADGGYVFEVVEGTDAAEDQVDPGACAGEQLREPMAPVTSTADSGSIAPYVAAGGAVTFAVLAAVVIALRRRQA